MRWLCLSTLAALAAGCGPAPKPKAVEATPALAARILQFYAVPGIVGRGEAANLCYGTENVSSVRIEPPIEKLSPALSRCLSVSPATTTTYKLIVEGPGGERLEKSAEVIVSGVAKAPESLPGDPKLPRVVDFRARQNDVAPGTEVMLCYSVSNAREVKVFPGVAEPGAARQGCFTVKPDATRDYTLIAVGASNIIDRKTVTVRVK